MALGGGTFEEQDKVIPGSYINIISASRAVNDTERGTVTMPLLLDWGPVGKVFKVTQGDFTDKCLQIFGYDRNHKKMIGLRDLFKNTKTLYAYRIDKDGVKAQSNISTSKYPGILGNIIRHTISANIDNVSKKDVITYFGDVKVDKQTVGTVAELLSNNFVEFKPEAELTDTASMKLSGGTNGSTATIEEYQEYLDAMEPYAFNTIGCLSVDERVKALFAAYTKRMSEEVGAKFQCVLYKHSADYEGIISVENKVLDEGAAESELVYWTLGAEGGCEINKSLTNRTYDGDYTIETAFTQSVLEEGLASGKLIFHQVGDEVRVLKDINTFVSFTDSKNELFSDNSIVRIMHQIAMDIAYLFNSAYLGKIPNDSAGRTRLWNDIVNHHQELEKVQAITNFIPDDVKVEPGEKANSVTVTDTITVMKTMEQLYMTVVVQ